MLIIFFTAIMLFLVFVDIRFLWKTAITLVLVISFVFLADPAPKAKESDPMQTPHYQSMIGCFSEHPIPPEAMVSAKWNDLSFLGTPKECASVVKAFKDNCKKGGGDSDGCSAESTAAWIAVNDAHPKSSQGYSDTNDSGVAAEKLGKELNAGRQNPNNDYALNNNPFERNLVECFATRIAMGGKWNPDDGLQSATKLAADPACETAAAAYFNWCTANGAETNFCGSAVIEGAELIIKSTPYHLRMRETAEEREFIENAIEKAKKEAESGDVNAQTRLGLIYFESNGIRKRSPEKALPWFERAAAQGSMDAQAKLGIFYMYGLVVKRDPKTAESWWKKAAAQGSIEAANYLGSLYENGADGISANPNEAIKWYKKAAASGDSKAQGSLKTLEQRLKKNPAHGSNILFMDMRWGINETSDQDPACMQEFDHDMARYKLPSRHSLDICLLNMVHGGTPWSDPDACSTPLKHWCQDRHLNPTECMAAKKAEYEEIRQACPPKG